MSEITNKIKAVRWQHLIIMMLMVFVVAGTESCKSTGKMSKKERKAQIESAKQQLKPIIDGTTTLSLEEQKRVVSGITDKNLNDPIVNSMILDAQQKIKTLQAEQDKLKAQEADMARATLYDLLLNKDNLSADQLEMYLNKIKAQKIEDPEVQALIVKVENKIKEMRSGGANLPLKTQLEKAFNAIASSASAGDPAQADVTIDKTLQYFSSDDVPVLIIISREGSIVDYDKPTTIKRYLNLIKDTKASKNAIDAIMTDANGKIKGLDLIKK